MACGQHAILVVQIDKFETLRAEIGEERTAVILKNLEKIMKNYSMEDTLVARYNDYTFAVILHYLTSREEISEMANEIQQTILAEQTHWKDKVTVSIGGAECHHDPKEGYKCATRLAMEALGAAKLKGDTIVVAPDTLPPHPLAVKKGVLHR